MSDPRTVPIPVPDDGDGELRIIRFDEIHEPESAAHRAEADHAFSGMQANAGPTGSGLCLRDAFSALDELRSTEHVVEAVHVMRTENGRTGYVVQQLSFDRSLDVTGINASGSSIRRATEFIDAFPDPGDGSVTYVLLITDPSGELRRAA